MASVIVLVSLVFAWVESQSKSIHFPSVILFLKNWLHPFLFIPLFIVIFSDFKTHLKTQRIKAVLPCLIILFSLLLITVKIRNEVAYLMSWESTLLEYSNRLLVIFFIGILKFLVIEHFKLWDLLSNILTSVFGKYEKPIWLKQVSLGINYCLSNKKQTFTALFVYLCLFGAGKFLVSLEPRTKVLKDASQKSAENVQEKIKRLEVYFTAPSVPRFELIDKEVRVTIYPLNITFSENPYKLDEKKKPEDLFEVFPATKGKWEKVNERFYRFMPKDHWLTDQEYTVKVNDKYLRKNIELNELSYEFKTDPVKVWIDTQRFYVNPKNSDEKKVVVALRSNYPLEKESVEHFSEFQLKDRQGTIIKMMKSKVFEDEIKKRFYLHSESLKLGTQPQQVKYVLKEGVVSPYSKKASPEKKSVKISIPSKFSFLNIDIGKIEVRNDEDDKPYHSIKISANTRIREDVIKKHFFITRIKMKYTKEEYQTLVQHYGEQASKCFDTVYRKNYLKLRLRCPMKESGSWTYHPLMVHEVEVPYQFKSESIIDETKHELIIEPIVGETYELKLKAGLKSVDGFELEFDQKEFSKAQAYPKILRFANEGSILSLNGKRKISIYGRGVSKAKIRVRQLKAHQLQHFLSLSSADKKNPYFNNYSFKENRITDEYKDEVYFKENLKRGEYSEFDFSKYINNRSGGKLDYGIFFVTLYDSRDQEKDSQLFILSDMAYIIKRAADGKRTVYVASQTSKSALSGVAIEQMMINGVTKSLGTTGDQGEFNLPKRFEDDVTGYLLTRGQDVLFISRNTNDQAVDYSRFEIAGEYSFEKKLRVSIFSDRKLYRPGESGHLAFIFKDSEWSKLHEGELVNIEIRDARGKVFLTQDQKIQNYGLNTLTFDLSYAAPTGSYSISVSSYQTRSNLKGDYTYKTRLGSHTIKVQEFLPDKMKIAASFNKGSQKLWISPKNLSANVSLRNLFGTPAVGNEIRASIVLSPRSLNLYKFPSYSFFDETIIKKSLNEDLKTINTNEQGRSQFDIDLSKYAENTFNLTFRAEGYMKAGGRSVVTEKSLMVSPHEFLVGMKPLGNLRYVSTSSKVAVSLVAVGSDHQSREAKVDIVIYEKKYQNALVKQADHTYAYQDVKEPKLFKKESITIPATLLKYELDNSKVGDYLVEILSERGQKLNSFEYSVVGEADLARSLYRNNELKLTLNKEDYAPGETIQVSIKAPYTGVGLITIEKEKVYSARWFKLDRETSIVSIKVPKDLEGNGYINVSLLRDLNSKKVFTSPFSYAVVPFTLDKSKLKHNIEIEADNLVKPGDQISIRYKAENPGKIIIYAVDKGIHQIANYRSPNPLGEFFKKQALRVNTYQIFSLILPDIEAVKSAFAAGGGAGDVLSKNLNPFKRKFTKAVAFWSDALDADSSWKNYTFQIPFHFNGELSWHAIYVDEKSIGVEKGGIISRDDLIITPTLPTFSAPGDEFILSAAVANNIEMDESSGDGSSKSKTDEVIVKIDTGDRFEVLEDKSKKLQVKRAQDDVVTFKLKTKKALGSADITIEANSGSYSSLYQEGVSIRPLIPRVNRNWQYLVSDGEYKIKLDDVKFHSEFFEMEIDLYEGLFALLKGNLRYLSAYPYGCSEQVTSKAIPYAVLPDKILEKSPLKRNEFLQRTNNILLQRQNENGSISLYSGSSGGSDYLNLYIANFLTVSKAKGYFYNKRLFERLMSYVNELSQGSNNRSKAYALYLQSLNEIQVGANAKLLEQEKSNDIYVNLYLAGIYSELKNEKKAQQYIEKVEKMRGKFKFEYSYGYFTSSFERNYLGMLYKYFPDKANKIMPELVDKMVRATKEYGANALWSGQALLSLASLSEGKGINAQVEVDTGKTEKKIKFTDLQKMSQTQKQQIKNLTIDISKKTFGLLSLNLSGFPEGMKNYQNGIQMKKRLLNENGDEVNEIKNGEELVVELSVQGDRKIRNAVIVDLLPGGFDLQWKDDEKSKSNLETEYVDQREDRIIVYAKVDTSVKKFYYKIKAIAPGKYIVPPTYGENMYKTVESALTKTDEIKITQ